MKELEGLRKKRTNSWTAYRRMIGWARAFEDYYTRMHRLSTDKWRNSEMGESIEFLAKDSEQAIRDVAHFIGLRREELASLDKQIELLEEIEDDTEE